MRNVRDDSQKIMADPNAMKTYRTVLPMSTLTAEMSKLARISPSRMQIAVPMMGRKEKNPIHAPRSPMKRRAFSSFSWLTCR